MDKVNIDSWLKKNDKAFEPPVSNKLLESKGQLKIFFVAGPNKREDFHIEDGEELFYMWKGDMCLKILEKNVFRDIIIKEGELFLLPARVFHSPQRKANTIGFVIERERDTNEFDGIRYFVKNKETDELCQETLFERYLHLTNLEKDLQPVFQEYFASPQYQLGRPIVEENPTLITPADPDAEILKPIRLADLMQQQDQSNCNGNHNGSVDTNSSAMPLFVDGMSEEGLRKRQFSVFLLFQGSSIHKTYDFEAWIWNIRGKSIVSHGDMEHTLLMNDALLIPKFSEVSVTCGENSNALLCFQRPLKF